MAYDIKKIRETMKDVMSGIIACHSGKHIGENFLCKQPFPGFVGNRYNGLVIIGRSPSSYSPKSGHEDEYLFKALLSFKENKTMETFLLYQCELKSAMARWGAWEQSNDLCDECFYVRHNINLDNIAFINLAKCRPLSKKDACISGCYEDFTKRQLEILNPTHILYLFGAVKDLLVKMLNYTIPPNAMEGAYYGLHTRRGAPITRDEREEKIIPVIDDFLRKCPARFPRNR